MLGKGREGKGRYLFFIWEKFFWAFSKLKILKNSKFKKKKKRFNSPLRETKIQGDRNYLTLQIYVFIIPFLFQKESVWFPFHCPSPKELVKLKVNFSNSTSLSNYIYN